MCRQSTLSIHLSSSYFPFYVFISLECMGKTPIPTGWKEIYLHPRQFAETVIKYLYGKAGGAVSSTGVDRKVWQCSEWYKVKGVIGCTNHHVEEETLIKAYLMA